MRFFSQTILPGVAVIVSIWLDGADLYAGNPVWSGRAQYRILVDVPAVELSDRDRDVTVASLPIDFPSLLQKQRLDGQFDPSSMHIHQYDPVSGRAIRFEDGGFAADPQDIPCRFDDELSPKSDLSRVGSAIDSENGLVRSTSNTPQGAVVQSRACFHGRKNCLDAYPVGEIKFEVCDLL